MPDFLSNNIAAELAKLHKLSGVDFVRQLKNITQMGDFKLVEGETNIYTTISDTSPDFSNLLNAAKKAVEYGFTVYILPNPKEIRTADFIFERKGIVKIFDLKTISGKSSVGNRLQESVGQTNRVLLNVVADINPMVLARNVKKYFESNSNAIEVLIFKGGKSISTIREDTEHANFFKIFVSKYIK